MKLTTEMSNAATAPPLELSRVFAAPRERVFQAWSHADHIRRWFSPEGCSVPEAKVDFRVGGAFVVVMRLPDGTEHVSRGTFVEIVAPERLVLELGVDFEGVERFTAHTAVSFESVPGGTRMSVRQSYVFHDPAFAFAAKGAPEGWRTTLDKLDKEVARIEAEPRRVVHGDFTITRIYEAPPARVYRALTDKQAKARWFVGPPGYVTVEREMDVRHGGRERLRGLFPSGTTTLFDAVYLDVVPDQRLVYAYEMYLNDAKISVSLATMRIEPDGAGTRLTVTEQGAFLDGYDDAGSRERGTGGLLDQLGASLAEP